MVCREFEKLPLLVLKVKVCTHWLPAIRTMYNISAGLPKLYLDLLIEKKLNRRLFASNSINKNKSHFLIG